MKGKVVPTQNS